MSQALASGQAAWSGPAAEVLTRVVEAAAGALREAEDRALTA